MKKRVLIVDDAPTVRSQLVSFLSDDFQCKEATDGKQALALIGEELPDAVVADLAMPLMDGITLLRRLREDPKTRLLPVVIVTSGAAVELVNECRALGCAGFV